MNTEIKNPFEFKGYFKDFYIDNKYVGSINHVEKDREVYGYNGRKSELLNKDIILTNKKVLKSGTKVVSELQILCGKKI